MKGHLTKTRKEKKVVAIEYLNAHITLQTSYYLLSRPSDLLRPCRHIATRNFSFSKHTVMLRYPFNTHVYSVGVESQVHKCNGKTSPIGVQTLVPPYLHSAPEEEKPQ